MVLKYSRIIFLGLYDEVNGIKRLFIKIYCVIYCTVLCALFVYITSNLKLNFFLYDSISLLEAIMLIVVSLVTEDQYFFLFAELFNTEFCDIRLFSATVFRKRILLTVLAFTYNILGLFYFTVCDFNLEIVYAVLFNGIVFISCCTGFHRMIVTFELFRITLSYWRKTLKEDLGLINTDKINLVNKFVFDFLKLIEHLSPVRYVSKFFIGSGIISIILKTGIFALYYIMERSTYSLTEEDLRKFWLGTILWVAQIITNCMFISIPIITLEIADDTLVEIMKILSEQLLINKDKGFRAAIQNAIVCIENRSNFTIWRNYPMDISLCFSCLSLVITFAISMLQFIY